MKEFIMLNILICSGISDLRDYKITNSTIVLGWAAGLCLNCMSDGVIGILNIIFCISAVILIGLPLFIIGGIGAGDIKLLSVIGAIYGLIFLGKVTVLLLIIAGIISLIRLIRKRALIYRIRAFIYYLVHGNINDGRYFEIERDGKEFAIRLAPLTAAAYFIEMLILYY